MKSLFTLVCMFLVVFTGTAQDLHFSQYYASSIYLNPGFTGSTQGGRVGVFYRNQWPNLDAKFNSYMVNGDFYFEQARSSVGFIAKVDELGGSVPIRSTDFQMIYSYMLPLSEKTVIQPALQVGYINRSLNYQDLLFPDQLSDNGVTGAPTQEAFPTNQVSFVDISTGAVLLSEKFMLGVSAHHLNQPNQSFYEGESILPTQFSVQTSYRITYDDYTGNDRSIIPSMVYKRQGNFQQLSLGCYASFDPIVIGGWYRGMPFASNDGNPQQDAFVFVAGLKHNGFQFGYSYDMTMSQLSRFGAGAHEISLVLYFGKENVRCPDPWGASPISRKTRRW